MQLTQLVVFLSFALVANCFMIPSIKSNFIGLRKQLNLNSQKVITPIFDDSCEYSGITLTRYLIEFVAANPQLQELESLIVSLQVACKSIANVVERASITGITGLEGGGGSINIQGEEQKKLDVITNDIMKKALRYSGKVNVLASEEEDSPVSVEEGLKDKYSQVGLKTTSFDSEVIVEETAGGKYVAVFVSISN